MGLHSFNNGNPANGKEVTAVILGTGMVVHLALPNVGSIISTPALLSSTHYGCNPIHFDEQ